jgi:hypothetical protein
MNNLGVFLTCYTEQRAVEYLLIKLNEIYPNIPVYLVSESRINFNYLISLYNIKCLNVEDTMSATFKITKDNFLENVHQENNKKCALATLQRLQNAIDFFGPSVEYILMMDPDALVRGPLTIPKDVKLLGSRVNSGLPEELRSTLASIKGAKVINNWGATPAIFHVKTFLKGLPLMLNLMDTFCKTFYAIYAHDVLLPLTFALVGEEETFNPDIIECNRDPHWENKPNPLVHQFKRYY